jgi:hypothetical protein
MKKNKYGNMEDLLISVRVVTPVGTLHRDTLVPRISSGPDINQVGILLFKPHPVDNPWIRRHNWCDN